jgi:hypothetical protein
MALILSFDIDTAKLVTMAGNAEILTKGYYSSVIISAWNDKTIKGFPIVGTTRLPLWAKVRHKDMLCHWDENGRCWERTVLWKAFEDIDKLDLFIYAKEEEEI